MPLDEDADDLSAVVADRLVDEVEIAGRQQAVGRLLQLHGTLASLEGLARRQDLIEEVVIALTRQLRQGLANGFADHVAATNQLAIGAIVQLDDMLRAVQDGDEAWRLHEHVQQLPPFRLQPTIVSLHAHGAADHAAADQAVQGRGVVFRPQPSDLAAQPFQFRDVAGVLQDMGDLARRVLDRRMAATPVAVVIQDRAVVLLDRDRVVKHRQIVRLPRRQDLVERCGQLAGVLGRFLAWPGVEGLHHRLTQQILAAAMGHVQIGLVHSGIAQLRVQQHVGVGRGVERCDQIDCLGECSQSRPPAFSTLTPAAHKGCVFLPRKIRECLAVAPHCENERFQPRPLRRWRRGCPPGSNTSAWGCRPHHRAGPDLRRGQRERACRHARSARKTCRSGPRSRPRAPRGRRA
ncbi:hypothetical protein D3C72_1027730 [compost metagenome]